MSIVFGWMRTRPLVRWLLGLGLIILLVSGMVDFAERKTTKRNHDIAVALTGGDPARAPALIRRYGCGGCHTISAIRGADGQVAAPLDHLRKRVYIAGVVQNTPANMVRWIVSPRTVSPRTAMPETGITEDEARHVAAFLFAH
jgi:cytochrome c2